MSVPVPPIPQPTLAQDLEAAAPVLDDVALAAAASMGAPAAILQLIANLLPFVQTAVENGQGMSLNDATAAMTHLQATEAKVAAHIAAMAG
jgi:hypothetical protein